MKFYRLKTYGVKVLGKIIWNKESKNSVEYKKYYQLVEYTVSDKSYQVFISFETYEVRKIGEFVEVLYDPHNPLDAIATKPFGKTVSFFIIFFCIFFIAFFIYFLFNKSLPSGTAPIYP
jgi:hypothetical protein